MSGLPPPAAVVRHYADTAFACARARVLVYKRRIARISGLFSPTLGLGDGPL